MGEADKNDRGVPEIWIGVRGLNCIHAAGPPARLLITCPGTTPETKRTRRPFTWRPAAAATVGSC